MALSGSFQADFSAFVKEAEKAAAALGTIETQGKTTEATINHSFTSLTAGATTATASTATLGTTSTNTFSTMANGLRTVDKTMSAFGVNVNPVINVLSELGSVAGRTAASLSLIEKASIVLAVAMATWQVGKWIYDVAGLDKSFADLAATMQGKAMPSFLAWEKRLEIGRGAILKGYQGDIMDTAGAMNFLSRQVDENAEKLNTGADRVQKWNKELNGAKGGLDALIAEVEAGNSTTEEMAKHFEVSARAIEYLKKGLTDATAATKEHAAADEKAATEAQAHADARQRLQDSMFGTDLIAKAHDYLAALGPIENLTRLSTAAQTALNTTLGQAIDAYTRMGQTAPQAIRDIYTATLPLPPIVAGLGAEWAGVGEKVHVTADAIIADLKRMTDETRAYEAETQRQVDAWNQSQAAVTDVGEATARTTQQVYQLADAGDRAAASLIRVAEQHRQAKQLDDAFRAAGLFVQDIGAASTYWREARLAEQRAGWMGNLPDALTGAGQVWGTGQGATSTSNTLTVNVNNADAQGIATKLVSEMKHQGYRL
jgi:hypothetical protein